MSKRTITSDEYDTVCGMMYQLTEVLLAIGIVEVRISEKEREIFWDTKGKGKIDPIQLDRFSTLIEKHWFTLTEPPL